MATAHPPPVAGQRQARWARATAPAALPYSGLHKGWTSWQKGLMQAYSHDLRPRILRAVDGGEAACGDYPNICRGSIHHQTVELRRETGDIKPQVIPGWPSKKGTALPVGIPPLREVQRPPEAILASVGRRERRAPLREGYLAVAVGTPSRRSNPGGMIRSSGVRSRIEERPRPSSVESMPLRRISSTFSTPVWPLAANPHR